MKLHLPHGLRKALLACLAALALPTSLPTTLGTASGWVAVSLLAPQQVAAADVTFTGARTNKNGDPYNAALNDSNTENDTWTFNVPTTQKFYFGTGQNTTTTHNANFKFEQTLTISDGFSGADQIFNGAFTGQQGANLDFAWASHTSTWQFNGDLSGFAGDILATTGTLNVVFGEGEGAKSNTGAIKQDGGTLNLTLNGQTMSNSEISVNNLTVNGATTLAGGSVTVAGALTLNSNASLNLSNVAGTYQFAGINDAADATGVSITGTKDVTLRLTGGGTYSTSAAISGYNVILEKSGTGTQKFTGTSAAIDFDKLLLTGGTLEFGCNLNVSGSSSSDRTLAWTQVSGGASLVVNGDFLTPNPVSVTGGSSMTVTGNVTLNTWSMLTVNGGATVTISGTLGGNKSGAGELRVGSHDDTGGTGTKGVLTLGTSGNNGVSHKSDAVKVYGEGSVLTVYGDLTAEGFEATDKNGGGTTTDIALEVKYGANATVTGNLTLGASDDNLEIGGTEDGNTGTLTVNGDLAGASVSVQGEGSTLTVDGTVTLTTESTLGAGAVMNVTGLGKVTGIEHLTGDGMLNVVLSADETPAAATQLNVNTTITTGEGVGAANVNLGTGKGLTLAGGKTLALGSGVTLRLNASNTLSLGADAKITLDAGAVLDVGDTIGRVKYDTTGWYNITGEGEVYQDTSGDIAAAGIKFDANYHIKSTKQGGTSFTSGVKSVSVRDLILEGSFNINSVDSATQQVTTLNLRGLVGESDARVNTNGTWMFNIGPDDPEKVFAGTFTSTDATRGANITKQGEGTQVFGTLGNFASLEVQAGKMKLNALNLTASYNSTITLASGATLDMSGATGYSITGAGLTIEVHTAAVGADGVCASGKLLLNAGLIEGLTELAGDKLTLKFADLSAASLVDSNAWTCDLFAGMTFAEGTTDALAAFLEKALDFTELGDKGQKDKDIVVGTDGHVTIVFAGDDLYMDAAGGTWKDKGDVVWHEGASDGTNVKFKNRDNVTFDDATGTDVTMEGELIAGNFTVTRGTWTFKNSAESEPSLAIQGEISVAGGSLILWESLTAVTILGDSFIDGTWTGKSMVVTLGDVAASDTSEITMEVGGNSDTSSMEVASIVTAGGDHAPTTHLVVTGQGHLEVGEVNVTDAAVGGTQSVAGIAADAAGSQLVVGTLTLTGSGTSADDPKDVLCVGEGGTVTVSSKLTSTGTNARITVDGGTLIVGTAPEGDTVVEELVLQMTESGSINVENGGSLQVYGQVSTESNGVIGSLTVSGEETIVGIQGTLYTTTATVSGGSFTVGGLLYVGGNGEDHVAIGTQIDGGGHLTAAKYTSTRNTVVTGGSTMEVTGNAELRNWADLTINDGATVTVNGTLKGSKKGENGGAYAGVIYVGGYDSTQGASKGTLTLGAAQSTTTHSVHGVKVYGTGSSLTVNGSLGTYGYDRVTKTDIPGLEVMCGATATISGNLACGDGNDVRSNLVLGGTGDGNTGTLTVGGTLTAGNVTITGVGSYLTVEGVLTESSIKGTVTLNGGKLTGKTAAGVTLDVALGTSGGTLEGTGNGMTAKLSGDGDLTAQGTLTLSGTIAGQLQVDGAQVTITGALSAGGLNGTSGTVNGGDLTITDQGGSFGGPLTVGNLTKSGSGTQTLTGSTTVNGSVSVTQGGLTLGGEETHLETHLEKGATVSDGGTLTLRSEKTTLGTDAWLKAVGTNSSIVLDFEGESWNKEESGNINVELAGGTLDMSKLTGGTNTQEVHLNHLHLSGSTEGNLTWNSGLVSGNTQSVHVGELSLESGGTLNFGKLGNGQELHLEQLKNEGGTITGTASNGGKVYLGYVTQAAGTSGSIEVKDGGGVHVHSHGGDPDGFRKQGEGDFAIKSKLIVEGGAACT